MSDPLHPVDPAPRAGTPPIPRLPRVTRDDREHPEDTRKRGREERRPAPRPSPAAPDAEGHIDVEA